MMGFYFLKIPVYLTDEGPEGAVWLFLMAGLGFVMFILGRTADDMGNSCLSTVVGDLMAKLGIGLMLTGIISGIISLF